MAQFKLPAIKTQVETLINWLVELKCLFLSFDSGRHNSVIQKIFTHNKDVFILRATSIMLISVQLLWSYIFRVGPGPCVYCYRRYIHLKIAPTALNDAYSNTVMLPVFEHFNFKVTIISEHSGRNVTHCFTFRSSLMLVCVIYLFVIRLL